ncbi:hypothetical protein KI387_024801, partial [Taxus chinensis]
KNKNKKEKDQQSVFSECSVHNGTLSKEDVDLIQAAKSVKKEEEQSAPSPIEEEQLEEIKSELRPLNEESIIEDFLLSFEGPDLIDESMMEEDHTVSEAP